MERDCASERQREPVFHVKHRRARRHAVASDQCPLLSPSTDDPEGSGASFGYAGEFHGVSIGHPTHKASTEGWTIHTVPRVSRETSAAVYPPRGGTKRVAVTARTRGPTGATFHVKHTPSPRATTNETHRQAARKPAATTSSTRIGRSSRAPHPTRRARRVSRETGPASGLQRGTKLRVSPLRRPASQPTRNLVPLGREVRCGPQHAGHEPGPFWPGSMAHRPSRN